MKRYYENAQPIDKDKPPPARRNAPARRNGTTRGKLLCRTKLHFSFSIRKLLGLQALVATVAALHVYSVPLSKYNDTAKRHVHELDMAATLLKLNAALNMEEFVDLSKAALKCSPSLRFSSSTRLFDRTGELTFCHEHQSLTCCDKTDTELLRTYIESGENLSPSCISVTARMMCAKCDAEVGIGRQLFQGKTKICPAACHAWYASCQHDYFAQGSGNRLGLDLAVCSKSSIVCSKLDSITTSPKDFCSLLGAYVADEEDPQCFDGSPATLRYNRGQRPPRRFSTPDGHSSYDPRDVASRVVVRCIKWLKAKSFLFAPSIFLAAVIWAVGKNLGVWHTEEESSETRSASADFRKMSQQEAEGHEMEQETTEGNEMEQETTEGHEMEHETTERHEMEQETTERHEMEHETTERHEMEQETTAAKGNPEEDGAES